MAKKGFTIDSIPNILSTSDKTSWALCIGAGTSAPIFPDWYTLADNLVKKLAADKAFNIDTFKKNGFSPDSLIQMIKNNTSLSDNEFAVCMSEVLYESFREEIAPGDWATISKILQSDFVGRSSRSEWELFIKYREELLSKTTAYAIARVILRAIDEGCAPKAILSFNAEPILLVLLNSLLFEEKTDATHPVPKKLFCKVISSISDQGNRQIPYIFCHGLLPIGEEYKDFSASIDKLVFSEQEYLQIANNAFSWQANTFLNACITRHVVFIGTSLTDPNMRRWLSWVHTNRMNEIQQNGIGAADSTQHYWIKKSLKMRPKFHG